MIDYEGQFSSAQAITSTAASTNVLDLLIARDIGVGDTQEINVYTVAAFTSGGTPTLQVSLQGSVDNATFYDINMSPVIAMSALVAGTHIFAVPMARLFQPNMQAVGMPRYIRLNYVVASGPFTGGTINAWIGADLDRQAYYTYPRNYTV